MYLVIRKEEVRDHESVFEVNRLASGQDNESRIVEKIRKGGNFIPELSIELNSGALRNKAGTLEYPVEFMEAM